MCCDEVADYLTAVSPTLGLIKTRKLPASPNSVLLVSEYPGGPSLGGFGVAGVKHEYVGIQLKARGEPDDDEEPQARLYRAYIELAKVQGTSLGSTYYLMARAQGVPTLVERDSERRAVFGVNFIMEKEPSA
jgi:hypothetical protein